MNLPVEPRQPPSRSDRLLVAAAAVAVVVLLGGVAVLAAARLGTSPAPSATAFATAGASSASPAVSSGAGRTPQTSGSTGTPGPRSSSGPSPLSSQGAGSIDLQVRAVEEQVPPLRGLEPTRDVPNRVLDEAALRADMTKRFDEENPPAELRNQQALLVRLGYARPGLDIRSVYLDALTTQILGFYDDVTKSMNIVQRGDAFGPLERLTLAHEYTHALQDQHFDLSSIQVLDTTQSDRALAHTALVEGDASLLMALWAQRRLTPAELQDVVSQSSDPAAQAALDRLPLVLRTQLTFPYDSGLMLVSGIYASGGWGAVDAAYRHLPETTEQVLHPAKYASGESAVTVSPPSAASLGAGWTESTADTAGELGLRSWLDTAGVAGSATAAAGWAGDRAVSYDGTSGAWAVAWMTRWDTPEDAVQFRDAAVEAIAAFAHARVGLTADGSGVQLAFAGDETTLGRVASLLGLR
jgi:hypothetical protein